MTSSADYTNLSLMVLLILSFPFIFFSFQEVLSVVRLVNIHHAPEMFLIWGGAKVVLVHVAASDALRFFQYHS